MHDMKKYNPNKIEKKWQKAWEQAGVYRTQDASSKPKYFILDMFPYPSGEALHVGHPKGYIASDIVSRFKRMKGFNVLHPMGWDAFGLPAENYAIKNKTNPNIAVRMNVKKFKKQLSLIGFDYDWNREINTTDPNYYKWTQWIFLQLFKKGLAYESNEPINWCPSCKTGLANEDLENGKCERCGSGVEKKPMRQWVLKITEYADRMLKDLDLLDWPDSVKVMQRNWIGRSEGAEITFPLFGIPGQEDGKHKVTVFTTRPDTLFGATFLVISAELAKKWIDVGWQASDDVKQYIEQTLAEEKARSYGEPAEKTGIFSGIYAENPANKERIPVWIANYVVSGYGTGAIMAVPAHDERDGEFAKKFQIPIRHVVIPVFGEHHDGEIFRKTISTVIQRKSDGKFLFLKWKQFNWVAPVIGGINDGETPEQASEREVLEEAGLKVKAVRRLGGEFEAHFFADNKNEWRYRVDQPVLLEIVGEAEQDAEGKEKFEILWLTADEAFKVNTYEYNVVGLKRFIQKEESFTDDGKVVNSDFLNNLSTFEAKQKITEWLETNGVGKKATTYRLKDWVFSRQRYWGEPIPIVHCKKCGAVAVPENELPVTLPNVRSYEPTGTGESPLANIKKWVNTKCPNCGGRAKRETNTMPQWAGSSWYYFRYADPNNTNAMIDSEKEKQWIPVDVYVGGDHATRHLIYARFWHKFLFDIGVAHNPEPFKRLEYLGMVLAEDGRKMSKRWGNVINPDDVVVQHGADTLRLYEMFMGPFEGSVAWSTESMVGVRRFLDRVWNVVLEKSKSRKVQRSEGQKIEVRPLVHQTIKKVTDDIEQFKFNTCVSQFMILVNEFEKEAPSPEEKVILLKLLSPFAPHIAEELWHQLPPLNPPLEKGGTEELSSPYEGEERGGVKGFIVNEPWPTYDESKLLDETVTVSVQFNGKFRGTVSVARGSNQEAVVNVVKSDHKLSSYLSSGPKKTIFVRDKIINFVV